MAFWSRIRTFDIYRDIPKDLTEQTTAGAIVSIVCVVVTLYLFLTEFLSFWALEVSSEMFVDSTKDTGNHHAMIQINMNISLPRIPCSVVSVDAQDVMGAHVVDVGGELHKLRLDGSGQVKLGPGGAPVPLDVAMQEFVGEGCRIHGNMIVKKVPGNFHVSAHAHANLLPAYFGNKAMDTSHIVHDLSFGEQTHFLGKVRGANVNPLAGASKTSPVQEDGSGVSYEYYLTIVPTQFERLNGILYDSFQFVANSNEVSGRYRIPAIYFRYDMSPITVCAIIGGVFTVLGIFNSVVHTTLRVIKKAEMGKLG